MIDDINEGVPRMRTHVMSRRCRVPRTYLELDVIPDLNVVLSEHPGHCNRGNREHSVQHSKGDGRDATVVHCRNGNYTLRQGETYRSNYYVQVQG